MSAPRKNRFTQAPSKKQDVSLQITSMADIFTILLVFLLKSYSSSEATVSPVSQLTLPQTKAGSPPIETLRLEISSDSVHVGGKRVVPLQDFRFSPNEIADLGQLTDAIGLERGRQLASVNVMQIEGADLKNKMDTRVTIMVDQKVPYQTLKKVMAVAAHQGFTDFKLAVVKANE